MKINVTKNVAFDLELVEECPEYFLQITDENGELFTLLTITEDGEVIYNSEAVEEAGLTEA